MAAEGMRRACDFQDARYAALYLDRIERFIAVETSRFPVPGSRSPNELSNAVAKHLALWMTYEDAIRVADLKTRKSRYERVRADTRAGEGQIIRVYEYMHPRVEEFCDLLPPVLAKRILASKGARKVVAAFLGKGRRVETTGVAGFAMLRAVAALRFMRRSGHRYAVEQARIEEWLRLVEQESRSDYALAVEIANLQRLIKGYGDTHERGLMNFNRILDALERVKTQASPAVSFARLREAALKDESGLALRAELARLNVPEKAVA